MTPSTSQASELFPDLHATVTMLGLLFAGEGLVPSAKVPLRTQQALGPLKARAVTTEMSALRTAAIVGVSA